MWDRFLYFASSAFLWFLNTSIMAGWMLLAVFAVRFATRRASKRYLGVLWLLVAIRLVLPISFRVPFSLIPSDETVPMHIARAATPVITSGVPVIDSAVNPVLKAHLTPTPLDDTTPVAWILIVCTLVWIAGVVFLLLYALVSACLTHRRVRAAVLASAKDKLWQCDEVQTPFVLGLVHPRIFVPSSMDPDTVYYVKRHEFIHILRRDQWRKLVGMLLLSVYWFHPLIWLAFILFCRDLETACDEWVIAGMDKAERTAYVNALLACAKPGPAAVLRPGFGEIAIKTRVRRILGYKRTLPWMNVVAAVLCVALGSCFLTLPRRTDHMFSRYTDNGLADEDGTYLPIYRSGWRLIAGCPLFVGAYNNHYDGNVYIYAADPTKRVVMAESHDSYRVQSGPMLRTDVVLPGIDDAGVEIILGKNVAKSDGTYRDPIEGVYLSDASRAQLREAYRRIENGEGDDTWHELVSACALVYLWYPDYPEMIRFYGCSTDLGEHVSLYHSSEIVVDWIDGGMYFTTVDYPSKSIEIAPDTALYRECLAFWGIEKPESRGISWP